MSSRVRSMFTFFFLIFFFLYSITIFYFIRFSFTTSWSSTNTTYIDQLAVSMCARAITYTHTHTHNNSIWTWVKSISVCFTGLYKRNDEKARDRKSKKRAQHLVTGSYSHTVLLCKIFIPHRNSLNFTF